MTYAALKSDVSDLGGGFSYFRRIDGTGLICAAPIEAAGATAVMSTAADNMRLDGQLENWLGRLRLPQLVLRRAHQVHGCSVIPAEQVLSAAVHADGMWTRSAADALTVLCADCAPVWIAAPDSGALALIHAGWRGVAAGILEVGVAALLAGGFAPASLTVAVGPHLQCCCFEVGPEVARRFTSHQGAVLGPQALRPPRLREDSLALKLSAAITSRLSALGVRRDRTHIADACTRCMPHILHSYRRNGPGGPLMAAAGFISA